ncbi:MAG: cardiolipin synthase, partial [Bacilli bacterium]|nr:cardiolipin synthase [Bacilli bacterium]
AMVGTINFDFRSLVHHFECASLIYKNSCLKDIYDDFIEMIDVSEKVPQNYVQKGSTRRLCSLIKIITPLL